MLKAEVVRPSELGTAERAIWACMMATTPALQRAFFSVSFADACESAHQNAFVAVLHQNGAPVAFFPFQFRSVWHRRLGLAERIGGDLSDNAGLVAQPGFVVTPPELLRLASLSGLFVSHIAPGQEAFGLCFVTAELGHVIDLAQGSAAYFAKLSTGRKPLVQDTERRIRRAERDFGELRFVLNEDPSLDEVRELIRAKRAQYSRTGVADPFADERHGRLVETLAACRDETCRPSLASLHAGDRLLARHLGLRCNGMLNYWFPVYDPEAQKVSPGRLLLWNLLKQADSFGIRFIDRGEGDSEAKRDFSTGTQLFGRANWFAGTPRAAAARLWQAAEWRVRKFA